jgi:flagellar basal body P-ring formation protein FlgA
MIRTLVPALAVLLAIAGSAAAQSDRPALRGNVTVAGDIVHIGDLIDNAGPVANVAIFRAPDLGTTGAVPTARIVEAIRPHQLIDIDTRGLDEVTVTRASRAIAPSDISASIVQALSRQYRIADPHDISLQFDRPLRTLQVEASATGDLQVPALSFDTRSGRFEATLDLPSSPLLHGNPPRFTGTAVETVDAVAVDRPVERGEVLQAANLTVVRRPKAQAADLVAMSAAIGMAARRPLRPGQPIALADLAKPEIVQRNDTVTLVYEAPGLTLTLRGQTQSAGALGDTIGVLNAQTKRVVQGIVSGPGSVMVAAATTHLVENASDPAPVAVITPPTRQE